MIDYTSSQITNTKYQEVIFILSNEIQQKNFYKMEFMNRIQIFKPLYICQAKNNQQLTTKKKTKNGILQCLLNELDDIKRYKSQRNIKSKINFYNHVFVHSSQRKIKTQKYQIIIQTRKPNTKTVVPKRDKMYKLEHLYEVDNFVKLLGYEHEFMGVLSSTEIQFFPIPFKRTWSDIINEEKRVVIKQKDKVLLNWLQEAQLIVQFQVEDDPIKNLLIFENVFQNQTPKVVYDIGVKNLVYCYLESGMLYTFCSDGLIRIFNQQYKYINHYDLEQGIESAIKVGSNYLIGTRNGKLILFDGQISTEIPFKTDMKCTKLLLDFNRVILKLDSTNETHKHLKWGQIIGPLHKSGHSNSIEMLKSYENEKLYLLVGDNPLDKLKRVRKQISHNQQSQLSIQFKKKE